MKSTVANGLCWLTDENRYKQFQCVRSRLANLRAAGSIWIDGARLGSLALAPCCEQADNCVISDYGNGGARWQERAVPEGSY